MNDTTVVEIADDVATITLNRPERNNAWNPDMANAFQEAMSTVGTDPGVRVVLITGAGRSFCVGADSSRLERIAEGEAPDPWRIPSVLALRQLDKPVIAAINGGCAGIGLLLALLCDIRFAAAEARLSSSYARRALPAEYGLSWLLPRIVGLGNAADLLLSGRTFTAPEARAMGLVNWVHPKESVVSAARDYAVDMAKQSSPSAMRMVKRQLYGDLSSSLDASILYATALLDAATRTEDFREGVASFVEKRAPRFGPLQ